ncbi:helix-turn-helix transcriptional regulator [Sediminicola arcticus]|uniref:WYL domain-containing transcriptional regulator n=1 Tax=Sediminicola arcticus TaxID=1574308 RepID=A0ABV2SPU2_9FLAO
MAKYPNIQRLVLIKNLLSNKPSSSSEILEFLEQKELVVESQRTIARDINILRDLGFEIENPTKNRGYLLLNSDYKEDLLERYHDFMVLSKLPKSKNVDGLITTPLLKGIELLPSLFEAVNDFYKIQFHHKGYTSETKEHSKPKTWEVFPLVLKEYQGKWHLHSYAPNINEFRTFGIDRMNNLIHLEKFNPDQVQGAGEVIELFKRRIGAAKPLEEYFKDGKVKPQLIKFWVSSFYLNYLKAKKLHYSQTITGETKELINFNTKKKITYTMVTYVLVPNYDLIKTIVSQLGEIILVEPLALRNYIKEKFSGLVSEVTRDSFS